jgi:hypothetical protein
MPSIYAVVLAVASKAQQKKQKTAAQVKIVVGCHCHW